jgi:hypothetical protein
VKRPKHSIDWVLKYRKHLQNLARVRVAVFGPDATKLMEKMKDVLAPAIDDCATANWERDLLLRFLRRAADSTILLALRTLPMLRTSQPSAVLDYGHSRTLEILSSTS